MTLPGWVGLRASLWIGSLVHWYRQRLAASPFTRIPAVQQDNRNDVQPCAERDKDRVEETGCEDMAVKMGLGPLFQLSVKVAAIEAFTALTKPSGRLEHSVIAAW